LLKTSKAAPAPKKAEVPAVEVPAAEVPAAEVPAVEAVAEPVETAAVVEAPVEA